jgi:protein CMS1
MFLTRDTLLQQKRKLNGTTESGDLDSSVALQSPAMISEYLSAMQAKSFSKMSVLELQDRLIPGTCVLGKFSRDVSWLTLSGRELHSGHDCMDGVEELGHVGRFYCSRCVFLSFPLHPVCSFLN